MADTDTDSSLEYSSDDLEYSSSSGMAISTPTSSISSEEFPHTIKNQKEQNKGAGIKQSKKSRKSKKSKKSRKSKKSKKSRKSKKSKKV